MLPLATIVAMVVVTVVVMIVMTGVDVRTVNVDGITPAPAPRQDRDARDCHAAGDDLGTEEMAHGSSECNRGATSPFALCPD